MPNILIRDLSQAAIDRIDAAAGESGLSRNEYLRRRFEDGIRPTERPVSDEDWQQSVEAFSDLADLSVMGDAWQ